MTSTLPVSTNGNGSVSQNGKLPALDSRVSDRIRARLREQDVSFLANDNVADHILPGELDDLQVEVADRVRDLLHALVIDIENDHNTAETAERVAKMYLHEVFKGRYHHQPKVASFPNVKRLDEIYTVGPITVRSACSHHLVPIMGNCWIGIKPGERVIGLSKSQELLIGFFQDLISRKKL